jgi:ABC-type sugar transport system permease subunit
METTSKKLRKPISESLFAILLILPSLIVILGIITYPLLNTFYLSLHKINLTQPLLGRPFVGLANYIDILTSQEFWLALGRTAYFAVASILIELTLGIAIAILFNQKFRGRWFLRGLIMIPWALPTIVNGATWRWIYNADYGALNAFLVQIGFMETYKSWLGDPFLALNMVVLADAWKMTPLVVILVLAALQSIPKSLYEAAYVDGATAWRAFWKITLPLLKPTILVLLVMRTMDTLKVFDIIFAITRGGPANGTQVITYLAYNESFSYLHLGKGSAVAYTIAFLVAGLTLLYVKFLKTDDVY